MMRWILGFCLAIAVIVTTGAVQAGSALIGGRTITCSKGSFQWQRNVPGIGLSIIGSGIIMDTRLRRFHKDFQRFVFLHECAHQHRIISERQADCWAINRGVRRGYFRAASVKRICAALWNTPMGIAHNAGPDRCRQMVQCYAQIPARARRRR